MPANLSRFFQVHAFAVMRLFVFALCLVLFAGIVYLNDGKLIYTLDDAYIHLAVSEEIWRGGYGFNAGEFAAPSSSMLFPFLLAAGAFSKPLHQFSPLIIDLIAVFAMIEILRAFLLRLGFGRNAESVEVAAVLIGAFVVAFHLVGLIFSGMEHDVHIAVSAAVVLGLVVFLEERRLAWWFMACVVLCPLIRYEGIALSLATLVCVAYRGEWRAAIALGALIVAILGAFSFFLMHEGLPFLPGSILVKLGPTSPFAQSDPIDIARALWSTLSINLANSSGLLIALAAIAGGLVIWEDLAGGTVRNDALVAFVLVAVAFAHDLVGQFGWWGRYEIYALVSVSMLLTYLVRGPLAEMMECPSARVKLTVGGVAVMLAVGAPYLRLTALTPMAANNIYEQQYMMHSFIVDEYRAPVAVNDLGWTSYQNDNYVFDLTGLGSEEARLAEPRGSLRALDPFLQKRGIKLAMIYKSWFTLGMPENWQCVGTMYLSRKARSAAYSAVQFCATDRNHADEIRNHLLAFRRTLPARIKLDVIAAEDAKH
jgi:hypothetical protein